MSPVILQKRIFLMWYPLLTAWLLMALEGPLIAAVLARLPQAKVNLAAYGVAFIFALIVEAPVIMLMSASTALVRDRNSFDRVLRYTTYLNVFSTALVGVLLLPPVFDLVAQRWMNLPPTVAELAWKATLLLLPWPAAIGFRRFYQGVMIVSGKTRRVMGATLLRVTAMATTCLMLAKWSSLEGAAIGGAALSAGVITEAIIVRLIARSSVREISERREKREEILTLTMRVFLRFYYPLTLTAFLTLGVQPLVTFFVGRASMPLESLAVLPVLHGINFFFRCFSLSLQEVIIAQLAKSRDFFYSLRRFATSVAVLSTCLFTLIALTPLGQFWIEGLAGLPRELADLTRAPLMVSSLLPVCSMIASFWSAVAMAERRTLKITIAALLEVVSMTLVLFFGVIATDWSGALLASLALVIGRCVSAFYLWLAQREYGVSSGPLVPAEGRELLS